MISIDGLVSGLDTSSIIEGLLSIQQSQLDRLNARKQEIQIRQTAFQGVEANVVALQSAAQQLSSFTNNVFSVFSASSSDEDILQAAASKDAVAGSYQLTVTQLARAEQRGSQSFSSADAAITDGDFSIQVGNRAATTIKVDTSNNTLQGLADAINAQTNDVVASIVNDGSGYRLLMTSQYTGADNTITIDNQTKPSQGSSVQIDFSGPAVQDAADAIVQFGSGAGAISVNRDTNTVDDVIEGLTLNLNGFDAGKEVTINVSRDIEPAREAIDGFVAAFNNVMNYVDEQTAYNAETEQGGVLLGDSSTNAIRDQIRNTLARSVANLETNANRLSAIGIEFDDRGRLQVDSSQLDAALAGSLEGVDLEDIRRLFSVDAISSDTGITLVSASSDTGVTEGNPWQVVVTQAAERAGITGGTAQAQNIVIDATNDKFSIEVDGIDTGDLSLQHGTYTQAELAELIQSTINNVESLGSREVSVAFDNDLLQVTSVTYGTRSEVGSFAGTAATSLGFAGSEYSRGKDVAGYFIVDGETEIADGNGRILSGDIDNENTAGLQLQVALTASQISGSHQSDLTVTRGFAATLDQLVGDMLDPDFGRFKNAADSYSDQIASVDASVERFNAIFESKQQQLISQFVAIESNINSLQTTSSFLSSQLGNVSLLANN